MLALVFGYQLGHALLLERSPSKSLVRSSANQLSTRNKFERDSVSSTRTQLMSGTLWGNGRLVH
eukprot:1574462-Amphidinium_carterae.1